MQHQLPLIVHGAAGRMGRRVIAVATADADCRLLAAIDHQNHPHLGQDAGALAGESPLQLPLTANWPDAAERAVVIDFSLPTAIAGCVQQCLDRQLPLVVATTGLDDQARETLRAAAQQIPIVWAPSMSLAVNVCMRLSQQITTALRDVAGGLDVEIIERHHRYKADAPSGTALRFGELIAEKLGSGTPSTEPVGHVHGREGHTGARGQHEIGYHAVRVGDNPGEHTIVFGMLGEKIELNVAASNRDCYAAGAIAAAKWLAGRYASSNGHDAGTAKPAGLYNMFDVLGFSDE